MATCFLRLILLPLSVTMHSCNIARKEQISTEQLLVAGYISFHSFAVFIKLNKLHWPSAGRTQRMRILLGLLYWTGVETIIIILKSSRAGRDLILRLSR